MSTTPLDLVALGLLRARGFRTRRVPTAHGTLAALEAPGRGELPPVVLVHGLSSRGTHFALVALRLLRHVRRVVIPDLLGHGRSEVPARPLSGPVMQEALDEALDRLLDEPFLLYGNSLGGYGVLRHAHRSPDRVLAVVAMAPGGAPLRSMSMGAYLERFRVRSLAEARRFAEAYFGRRPLLSGLLALAVRRQLRHPPVRAFIDRIADSDLLQPHQLAELPMPVLLLWGGNDQVCVPEQLEWFRQHLPPHARVEVPPHYGHAPYIERPHDLADRLLAFYRDALRQRP